MKVKELIEELKMFHDDTVVWTDYHKEVDAVTQQTHREIPGDGEEKVAALIWSTFQDRAKG